MPWCTRRAQRESNQRERKQRESNQRERKQRESNQDPASRQRCSNRHAHTSHIKTRPHVKDHVKDAAIHTQRYTRSSTHAASHAVIYSLCTEHASMSSLRAKREQSTQGLTSKMQRSTRSKPCSHPLFVRRTFIHVPYARKERAINTRPHFALKDSDRKKRKKERLAVLNGYMSLHLAT